MAAFVAPYKTFRDHVVQNPVYCRWVQAGTLRQFLQGQRPGAGGKNVEQAGHALNNLDGNFAVGGRICGRVHGRLVIPQCEILPEDFGGSVADILISGHNVNYESKPHA